MWHHNILKYNVSVLFLQFNHKYMEEKFLRRISLTCAFRPVLSLLIGSRFPKSQFEIIQILLMKRVWNPGGCSYKLCIVLYATYQTILFWEEKFYNPKWFAFWNILRMEQSILFTEEQLDKNQWKISSLPNYARVLIVMTEVNLVHNNMECWNWACLHLLICNGHI